MWNCSPYSYYKAKLLAPKRYLRTRRAIVICLLLCTCRLLVRAHIAKVMSGRVQTTRHSSSPTWVLYWWCLINDRGFLPSNVILDLTIFNIGVCLELQESMPYFFNSSLVYLWWEMHISSSFWFPFQAIKALSVPKCFTSNIACSLFLYDARRLAELATRTRSSTTRSVNINFCLSVLNETRSSVAACLKFYLRSVPTRRRPQILPACLLPYNILLTFLK